MIEITYFERNERYGIAIKGHAGYAPRGEDIVCASVTAILTSLGNYIQEHEEDDRWKILEVRLEEGDSNVEVLAANAYSNEMLYHLFHAAKEFFEDLAYSYPCHVKIVDKSS